MALACTLCLPQHPRELEVKREPETNYGGRDLAATGPFLSSSLITVINAAAASAVIVVAVMGCLCRLFPAGVAATIFASSTAGFGKATGVGFLPHTLFAGAWSVGLFPGGHIRDLSWCGSHSQPLDSCPRGLPELTTLWE